MVDRLRRLRGPVAWIVLAAAAAQILLSLIGFIYYSAVSGILNGVYSVTSQQVLVWVVLICLAVGCCAFWGGPDRYARALALTASVELGFLALLAVVFGAVGVVVGDGALGMLGVIINGFVAAALALVMGVIGQGMPINRRSNADAERAHPTQSAYPPIPGNSTQWQQPRSQTDQFGMPDTQYGDQYPRYSPNPGQAGWQPAAQHSPRRLEPSPEQPAVGPHAPSSDLESGRPDSGSFSG